PRAHAPRCAPRQSWRHARGFARNMLAKEPGEQTRIAVIATAGTVADNEVDPLTAVKIRDVGGGRRRGWKAKQRCGNKHCQDWMAFHETTLRHGDGLNPA